MTATAGGAAVASSTRERVRAALAGLAHREIEARDGMAAVEVARDVLAAALRRLRDAAGFEAVTFVTAVDRRPAVPRFEVVHQLYSVAHRDRVRVQTRVAEEDPAVPSCVEVWPGAAFMERECFDLLGIVFTGHPGLKRLMMPEDYRYHPLRKEFPQQGIEPDRHYREWDEARRRTWRPEE
ncbi:MAG: NADH-quinone oxidoreductase subunit C [Planctomycetota bacterium]